ncbi:helix-turn-helix domain-containing protein [Streptomyces sp. NPDC127033]|uniref:helix-turn-helix domain-containing protein n=1 Tax=Streptomyces sp. NPDC127033 TaxID=3347110 RepID=UPI003649B7F1
MECREHARREREGKLPQQPSQSALGRPLAEDLQSLAAGLLAAEYGGQGLETMLRLAGDLAKEVECYAAAAVHDARAAGSGWEKVALAARVSTTTARMRWNEKQILRMMSRRAIRHTRGSGAGAEGLVTADAGQPAARASQRLASALSHLHRISDLTIREVADSTGLSPSYVSRILSGERMPSWPVTASLARACGGEAEHVRALWASTQGGTQPSRLPFPRQLVRLQDALRGLYLAAARPDPSHLCRIRPGTLTREIVEDLLSGEMVPDWDTTGAFVSALGGSPADIRPLWEETYYAFLIWMQSPPEGAEAAEPPGKDDDGLPTSTHSSP